MPVSRETPIAFKGEKIKVTATRPQFIPGKCYGPRRDPRLNGRAAYVVSYLQASKEGGVTKGYGGRLCVNNYRPKGRVGAKTRQSRVVYIYIEEGARWDLCRTNPGTDKNSFYRLLVEVQ